MCDRVRQLVGVGGGPQTRANRRSQPVCQGQFVGRCRVTRRAEVAVRAGMVIKVRRTVPVLALTNGPPLMDAAARVRLKAMHANTNQAALAAKRPEGRCARAECFKSA